MIDSSNPWIQTLYWSLALFTTPPGWLVLFLIYKFIWKPLRRLYEYNKNMKELMELKARKHEFDVEFEKRREELILKEVDIKLKEKDLQEESKRRDEMVEKEYEKVRIFRELTHKEIEEKREESKRILREQQERFKENRRRAEESLKKIAEEKSAGFPWLADAYAEFFELEDMKAAELMETKKHPAKASAQQLKEIAQEKRSIQRQAKMLQYQIQYYESLFPWLAEFKNEEIAEELIRIEDSKTQDPEGDRALKWLTEGEYKKYPPREKYQLALDRYWKRHKTKFEIGRDYERYIGWTYEKDGYEVYYQGIIKGFDDLGRDLIVTKGKEVIVVQCKYWARDKTIHEKHVFQLYGTMTSHQIENPNLKVSGRFVTSTGLSDRAKKFSDHLGIKISENTRLEEYPCIKCNIAGRDGEKIYHLPFDQQYDTTKIEPEKGEFYCRSVAEAEDKGFRRAMRYRGIGVK